MATASDFIQGLPDRVTPEAIEGLQTLFHFDLEGEGGGQYTVEVNDGKMQVAQGLHGDPKCEVRSSAKTFMKVVNGEMSAMIALLTGKIKITNQSELVKYAKVFGLMK
jgi:putative sterol carrier protein